VTTDEPKRIFLGTVTVEAGEAIVFNIPLDADANPDTIVAAIERAELAKHEAQKLESARLRQLFSLDNVEKGGLS
jgi:hypothetical protein